jgi:hypothetical protein
VPDTYHCSNCRADLTWRLDRIPRLARCPHCGVALNQRSVEKAFEQINFQFGFWGGFGGLILFGLVGGGFVIGGTVRREPSMRVLGWVFVGIGVTLWAACFAWHDQRVRRALGRPGGWLRSVALWLAWAVGLPAALGAFLLAVYFGWAAIAPWLNNRDISASKFGGLFMVFFVVVFPSLVLTGRAIYRKVRRTLAGSKTSPAKTSAEARLANPVRDVHLEGTAGQGDFLLAGLLPLCHYDRAMCVRLIEHERLLRPHLSRAELVELAAEKIRADNR